MILLTVQNLRKHFGPEPVLDGVEFDVRRGDKVSLVGPNGAGKTTLMHIVAGLLDADAGSATLHPSARGGLLEQQPEFPANSTVWSEAQTALAPITKMAAEAERLAAELADCHDDADRLRLGDRYDQLQHRLEECGGYRVDHKIERVLSGLRFTDEQLRQPVVQLSGGQQNRLLLAKLLLAEPDLMLLDEPSNHLDIEATQWLESFLAESRQAILVVSHDRYFLDKVTTRTLELFRGTIESYAGNYSAYRRQKVERLEVQRRTFERQQTEIAKMEDFVRRHHHGQKHAQAEDRRKKLERIERVAAPREIAAPPMRFPAADRCGDVAIRVERLAKAYDQPLFANLTFDVLRGEKWGVLGPNGSGKTTLLRCLLGEVEQDDGAVSFAAGVNVAYFDQGLECLASDQAVVDAIRPQYKEFTEEARRDLLARFGVIGDMAFQKVNELSGGERNRVALAMLAGLNANLLVLDEPTNHLDLWARGALEKAIREFDGTVVFVSHDRYFINQVADHLLVVEPDRFRVVDGGYDTYLHLARQSAAAVLNEKPKPAKATRRRQSDRKKRKFPYRKIEDLETDVAHAEQAIAALHEKLSSPDVLRDGELVKAIQKDLQLQQSHLSQLVQHWEVAMEFEQ
jgi:ATP-binding cassette subfamily F protein 3